MMVAQKKRHKIAVLMGGPALFHETSLAGGLRVLSALPSRYLAIPVVVMKNRSFSIEGHPALDESEALPLLKSMGISSIFIAMHGEYGADGTLQRLLEVQRIPYTGSSSVTSRVAIDKSWTAKVLQRAGLTVPPFIVSDLSGGAYHAAEKFGLPLVIKPVSHDLRQGVSIVRYLDEVSRAVLKAQRFEKRFIAQKFIKGEEVTCGVLHGPKRVLALPPVHVTFSATSFLDYDNNYLTGVQKFTTPVPFPEEVISTIQTTSLRAHRALNCSGASRTDMIWDGKRLWVLEIETLPSMLADSAFAQMTQAAGVSFPDLLSHLIQSASPKLA